MLRSFARGIIDKALRDVRADLARHNAELARLGEIGSAQQQLAAKLDKVAEIASGQQQLAAKLEHLIALNTPPAPPARPVPPFMHEHGDLHYLHEAPFTEWVVANNLLETPFRVIDVGVNGGLSIR